MPSVTGASQQWRTGVRWSALYVGIVLVVTVGSLATWIGYSESESGGNVGADFLVLVTAPWSLMIPSLYVRQWGILHLTLVTAAAGLPNVVLVYAVGTAFDWREARRKARRRARRMAAAGQRPAPTPPPAAHALHAGTSPMRRVAARRRTEHAARRRPPA